MIAIQDDLITAYQKTRAYTNDLCSPLQKEDYVPQSAFFASPPKWHLGHTSWFYEALILKEYLPDYKEFHPQYNVVFNSYYNHLGDRVPRNYRGLITRPSVDEVYAYRNYVDENMIRLLNQNDNLKLRELTELGLNHEQQHQELLITDLKYTFSLNPLFPVYKDGFTLVEQNRTGDSFLSFPEGLYEIGFNGQGFCYDNELSQHKVNLQDFDISDHLVSNGEYLEFIKDGGYQKFEFWLDEGWTWINENRVTKPMYWFEMDGEWFQYTLAGARKLNPDHILCHVNYFEASAFANWKGLRLPTEFEWEAASNQFEWGKRWEWTSSAYAPYPGFSTAPGAVGEYNGKFMVNQQVLRGASTATYPGHSRKTYRNFFHPQFGWQCTGIRLAR